MRSWKMCCLALVVALASGCAKNAQKAHEIAAQNLYREMAYENAATPGPRVVVLPGTVTSPCYEFLCQVKPDTLRDFGENELGKANFKVLEKSALGDIYQEIAVAVNLGDGSLGQRFAKINAEPPRWIVLFDVVDVKTQTTAFSFTDKNAASFAGVLMGGIFLGAAGAQIGSGLIGSVSSAKEQRLWDITLQYRILDGNSGQEMAQGRFADQARLDRELTGFLGIDAAEAGGLTLSTVTSRLIQKAVQEIDKQHKLSTLATVESAPPPPAAKPGKHAPTAKASGTKTPTEADAAASVAAGPEIACTETRLGGFVCQLPAAWSTGDPPTAKEVAFAKKPQLAELLKQSRRNGKQDLIGDIAEFDVLKTAGPLVTLSDPQSPLREMGRAMALSGNDLEGRVFILSNASGKLTPEKLATAVAEHFRRAAVLEPLAVETVTAKDGTSRPIMVFKYIQVEQRKEVQEQPEYDRDSKPTTRLVSIPHYHNLAMAIIPKGNDLLLVIVAAPEDKFLPHLDGVKRMVESAA